MPPFFSPELMRILASGSGSFENQGPTYVPEGLNLGEEERRRNAPALPHMGTGKTPPSAPVSMNLSSMLNVVPWAPGASESGGGDVGGSVSDEPSFFNPMTTRYGDLREQVFGPGPGQEHAYAPVPSQDDGGDWESVPDEKREALKARLISAMEKYANYEPPGYGKFRRKGGRGFDEDDIRKMALRGQAGMEPILREIEGVQKLLGLTQEPSPEYKTVGDRLLAIGPSGARVAYEPPEKPTKPEYRTVGDRLLEIGPSGTRVAYEPPAKPPTPQRPIEVGGYVYEPDSKRWVTPPGGARPDGVPASVAGRALDAGVPPVPPGDPNYDLYQRIISGRATKEEEALKKAADSAWLRAYQDRLGELGNTRFGMAPGEADFQDARAYADRVRSDYLVQARGGIGPAPGNTLKPAAVRFEELKAIHPGASDDEIEEMMVDEGYGG